MSSKLENVTLPVGAWADLIGLLDSLPMQAYGGTNAGHWFILRATMHQAPVSAVEAPVSQVKDAPE